MQKILLWRVPAWWSTILRFFGCHVRINSVGASGLSSWFSFLGPVWPLRRSFGCGRRSITRRCLGILRHAFLVLRRRRSLPWRQWPLSTARPTFILVVNYSWHATFFMRPVRPDLRFFGAIWPRIPSFFWFTYGRGRLFIFLLKI